MEVLQHEKIAKIEKALKECQAAHKRTLDANQVFNEKRDALKQVINFSGDKNDFQGIISSAKVLLYDEHVKKERDLD